MMSFSDLRMSVLCICISFVWLSLQFDSCRDCVFRQQRRLCRRHSAPSLVLWCQADCLRHVFGQLDSIALQIAFGRNLSDSARRMLVPTWLFVVGECPANFEDCKHPA